MKRQTKMALLIALLITIVVYTFFVFWSLAEYNTYVSNIIAEYVALGIPEGIIDPLPYWASWYGQTVVVIGGGLTITWLFIATFFIG